MDTKNKLLFKVGEETTMKRKVMVLTLVLVVAIAISMIGSQLINAQQPPVKAKVLQKVDLTGIEGKEGIVVLAEIAPGNVGGKHYHPGHEFVYILEGSMILEIEGKPPVTYKAGDTWYLSPKQVHSSKNVSATAPFKVLAFTIVDKGQPLTVPVK
jgi:quercetin dioxygenase-like cupin family protein